MKKKQISENQSKMVFKPLWTISIVLQLLLLSSVNSEGGCSPEITHPFKSTREALENSIKKMMTENDEIIWGKIDSIKSFDSPKQIYYEGYNVGQEDSIFQLSTIITRPNPYLNIFQKYYVWYLTAQVKGFVYKIQIPETNSECGYEYLVKPGAEVPFVKSGLELKLIKEFYEYLGYKMVPGKDILGKIGLEIIWPDAPKMEK